jgi:hypothetical protein
MSALMTISGIIRTSNSGARVELDADGLRCYAADGTSLLFNFDISDNLMSLTGTMSTDLDGSRVSITPGNPSAGIQTPAVVFWADNATVPGWIYALADGNGAGPTGINVISSLDNSSKLRGLATITNSLVAVGMAKQYPANSANPNGVLAPDGGSTTFGPDSAGLDVMTSTSAGANRDGGFVYVDGDGAYIGHGDPDDNCYLQLGSDGSIFGIGQSGTVHIEADANHAVLRGRDGSGFNASNSFATLYCSNTAQVVNLDGSEWRPIGASAFNLNSSASLKEGFEELPGSALDILRNAPITRWRYRGDLPGEAHIGPVAEDLPEWAKKPAAPAARRIRRRAIPTEFDDTGRIKTPPRVVEEEETDPLPRSEQIDLMSWISTVAEAVRELDAEVDELRRQQGRPIPRRRTAAHLLADIGSGRFGETRDEPSSGEGRE